MSAVAGHYDQPFFREPPADIPRGPTGMILSKHHLGDTPFEFAALEALVAVAGRGDAIAPLANPQPMVSAWVADLATRQAAGEPTSILDHSALTYMLLKGVFDAPQYSGEKTKVTEALRRSWIFLTGKAPRELVQRLPWTLMNTARPIDRTFNAHVFETALDPKSLREYAAIVNAFRKDFMIQPKDIAALALVVGLGYLSPLTLGGALKGMAGTAAGVSVLEWFAHFALGHPPPWLKKFILTSPKVSDSLRVKFEGYWETHGLHHHATYKGNHFDRYMSPAHEAKLIGMLTRKYGAPVAEEMRKTGLGTGMDWIAWAAYYVPTVAIMSGVWAATAGLSWPVFLGIAAGSTLLPWGSSTQHPSDHERRDEAFANAPNALHRGYLGTELARYNTKHHYIHHRYVKKDINLNLNVGADMLFGRLRRAGMSDVLDLNHHRSI